MGENIISWNFTNWITVVVMVTIGFTILALIAQGYKAVQNNNAASA